MGTNGIEDGRKCGHEKNSFLIKVIYLKALVFKYLLVRVGIQIDRPKAEARPN